MITRALDAAAALACGAAVFLIAVRVKPMPSTLDEALTPLFAATWALLLLASCLTAAFGVTFRSRPWALLCEYVGWLGIAGMVLVFGGATAIRFGLTAGLTTVGFAASLSLLCLSRWWVIHAALWRARRREVRRET